MGASEAATMFVVDDDTMVERVLERLPRSAGWQLRIFATAEEVLAGHDRVVRGRFAKQMASDPGLSEKTVEVRSAHAMNKMEVRSVAEPAVLFEMAGPLQP